MEGNLRRSTRLIESNSTNSAPASVPIVKEKKRREEKKSAPVEIVQEDEDVNKQTSGKKAGTKRKTNKTSSANNGASTSRKRRSDDSKPQSAPKTQNKKSKVGSTKNSFDVLMEEVEGLLAAQRTEQVAYAKSQGWSYDPRAAIVTSGLSLHDVCLTGLGLETFDEIVDHIIKHNTYSESDATDNAPPPPFSALEEYSAAVTGEDGVSSLHNLSEAEAGVLGLNRLFQLVPAKYVSELLAASATNPNTKDELKEFLKTLDIGKLIEAHPHTPYFSDVAVIQTDEEDPQDSESSWCEKFNNHMEWLFEQFDAQKCVNLGRIYRALGLPAMKLADEEEVLKKEFMNLALSKLAGTVWRKVAAAAIKGDKEDDDENKDDDNGDDSSESWRAAPLRIHIAKLALFTFPFNYRTYTGTFAFNVRESDYDGSRCGIADYVSSMAEEFFKPAEFIQLDALRDNEELSAVENIITRAFYIPGLKSDLVGDLEDAQEEEEEA